MPLNSYESVGLSCLVAQTQIRSERFPPRQDPTTSDALYSELWKTCMTLTM